MNCCFCRKIFFPVFLLLASLTLTGKEQTYPAAVKEYDLNIPYKDEALSLTFPGKIGEFVKRFVRVNANERIGTSIHYRCGGGISADIYLYLPEHQQGEKTSDILQKNYRAAKHLLFTMEQAKKREDMPRKEEDFFREVPPKNAVAVNSVAFTFTAGEETFQSFLSMTSKENGNVRRLVKIRFSYPAELGKEGEKKWEFFSEEILKILFPGKEK